MSVETSQTTVKPPARGHNGDPTLNGRIAVGPLTRHKEAAKRGTRLNSPAGDLLAERDVYLDGEHVGTAYQWQRPGFRINQYGQRVNGPGLPTEWRFYDVDGRDWREADDASLTVCLHEALTLVTGGRL